MQKMQRDLQRFMQMREVLEGTTHTIAACHLFQPQQQQCVANLKLFTLPK
jgi:hypothetical protein